MSYTTLYKVPESGEIKSYREYNNAFRGAWLIWDTMSKHDLGKSAVEFMRPCTGNDTGPMQPVWDLWKNPSIPESYRLVMASTIDDVMVKRENLER